MFWKLGKATFVLSVWVAFLASEGFSEPDPGLEGQFHRLEFKIFKDDAEREAVSRKLIPGYGHLIGRNNLVIDFGSNNRAAFLRTLWPLDRERFFKFRYIFKTHVHAEEVFNKQLNYFEKRRLTIPAWRSILLAPKFVYEKFTQEIRERDLGRSHRKIDKNMNDFMRWIAHAALHVEEQEVRVESRLWPGDPNIVYTVIRPVALTYGKQPHELFSYLVWEKFELVWSESYPMRIFLKSYSLWTNTYNQRRFSPATPAVTEWSFDPSRTNPSFVFNDWLCPIRAEKIDSITPALDLNTSWESEIIDKETGHYYSSDYHPQAYSRMAESLLPNFLLPPKPDPVEVELPAQNSDQNRLDQSVSNPARTLDAETKPTSVTSEESKTPQRSKFSISKKDKRLIPIIASFAAIASGIAAIHLAHNPRIETVVEVRETVREVEVIRIQEVPIILAKIGTVLNREIPEGRVAEFVASEVAVLSERIQEYLPESDRREFLELKQLALAAKATAATYHDFSPQTISAMQELFTRLREVELIVQNSLSRQRTQEDSEQLTQILTDFEKRFPNISLSCPNAF